MGEGETGMRRGVFVRWAAAILLVAAAQSAAHLEVVLDRGRVDSIVDLDRSNGLPDLVSTLALAAAAVGAAMRARGATDRGRIVPVALAAGLALLALADLVHAGPHPGSAVGWTVIVGVVGTGVLLLGAATMSNARTRATLAVAGSLLVGSFLVNALDKIDAGRFDRERPDPVAEYQIVAKEGLELVGWSLVALALWDETLRRRGIAGAATARASRARASSRRRAA